MAFVKKIALPGSENGFSLVELVITTVIVGFFMLVVSSLLVFSYTTWFKSENSAAMNTEYRYCEIKIEQELRTANAVSYVSSGQINFTSPDGSIKSFQLSGSDIYYICTGAGSKINEKILSSVTGLNFEYANTAHNSIKVTIAYQRIINKASNKTMTESNEFIVKCRNII